MRMPPTNCSTLEITILDLMDTLILALMDVLREGRTEETRVWWLEGMDFKSI